MKRILIGAALASMAFAWPATAQAPAAPGASVTPAFNQPISNIPGKNLIAAVVTYPPGGKSKPHHHAPSAFIEAYVISGAIRSQVDDGPVKIYHAGEGWFEKPGAHHTVSENASATEPAKMLAIFVVDSADTVLTTPDRN